MTFGLLSWLKSKYADLVYEVPLWYPSREQPDHREWLLTNGLGGYSSGTVSGAHTRRYHGLLISALDPPHNRHVILSQVDELLTINGTVHQLATNHWASGVVSPTGYKQIESFTTLPTPTWVYEFNGNYLIKECSLTWGTDELHIGYTWLPDSENPPQDVRLSVRFLTGYRNFHEKLAGSSDDRYPQFVSPNHSVIILSEAAKRLCLTWTKGEYESQKQWWWDYHWPEETARGEPDHQDLFFVGNVSTTLTADQQFSIGASLDKPIEKPDCHAAVEKALKRQRDLLRIANLPRTQAANLLVLACDQFLVSNTSEDMSELGIIEGYPWFAESGRAAMISMPGLTLATRRFEDGKRVLKHYSDHIKDGIMPNRYIEEPKTPVGFEYGAADVTLWWAWALYQYHKTTKDLDFVKEQLPLLIKAANHYIKGTNKNIKIDPADGLLRCSGGHLEHTWMDTKVADYPITPRAGKAVELCALWYNFLETIIFFSRSTSDSNGDIAELEKLAGLARQSMQKFWNADRQCLFDVIEPGFGSSNLPEQSLRPNQLLALSLPYRSLTTAQEKSILIAIESELLTPMGVRTLAATDSAYQNTYGCGFSHADQYHRDLSYHQGMAWPWFLGAYCDALINVFGLLPETTARINLVMQPLLSHLVEEAGLGSISEIFDGSRPHLPRGSIAQAWSVAEVMRFLSWQNRR
ncbi:amylo-alpha-1,6-glucosidase [soil metagenome]